MEKKLIIISIVISLITSFNFLSKAETNTSFTKIKVQKSLQLNFRPLKNEKFAVIIANPNHNLVLVNKKRHLPIDYKPKNLIIPDILFLAEENKEKKYLKLEAASALEKLFSEAKKKGLILAGISGYRSYSRQKTIFNNNLKKLGRKKTQRLSAKPGASEHQTGLAIDVSSREVHYQLIESFGASRAGIWLAENAYKYGFIIRYPENKEKVTGYQYEPWHLRYVGLPHSQIIHWNNLTLEEYIYQETSYNKKDTLK